MFDIGRDDVYEQQQESGGFLSTAWDLVKGAGALLIGVLTLGAAFEYFPGFKNSVDKVTGGIGNGWATKLTDAIGWAKDKVTGAVDPIQNTTVAELVGSTRKLPGGGIAMNPPNYLLESLVMQTPKSKEFEETASFSAAATRINNISRQDDREKAFDDFFENRKKVMNLGLAFETNNKAADEFMRNNPSSPKPVKIPLALPELTKPLKEYGKSINGDEWETLSPLQKIQNIEENLRRDTRAIPDYNTDSHTGLYKQGALATGVAAGGVAMAKNMLTVLKIGKYTMNVFKASGVGLIGGLAGSSAIDWIAPGDNSGEIDKGGDFSRSGSITDVKQIVGFRINDNGGTSFLDTNIGKKLTDEGYIDSSTAFEIYSHRAIAKLIQQNRFEEAKIIIDGSINEFKNAKIELVQNFPDKESKDGKEFFEAKGTRYDEAIKNYEKIKAEHIRLKEIEYELQREGGVADQTYKSILNGASLAPGLIDGYTKRLAESEKASAPATETQARNATGASSSVTGAEAATARVTPPDNSGYRGNGGPAPETPPENIIAAIGRDSTGATPEKLESSQDLTAPYRDSSGYVSNAAIPRKKTLPGQTQEL